MLAHYGYQDGAGEFYITIDTGLCARCTSPGCVAACPAGVLAVGEDDWGDRAAAVREEHRRKIRYSCAPCKPAGGRRFLPCRDACPAGAIQHSW